jgi:EpsI family protein
LIYGWVFFGVVIMILYLIGARWAEPELALVAVSASRSVHERHGASRRALSATLLAGVLVVLAPQLAAAGLQRAEVDAAPPHLALPDRLGDWDAAGAQIVEWKPRFQNPSAEVRRAYASEGRTVGVYLAYFRGQGPDRKLVSSQNVLVTADDTKWNQVATGRHQLTSAGGPLALGTAELLGTVQSSAQRRAQLQVWRSYWVNDNLVAGDAAAKLQGALSQLRGQGDDGALIVLYADGESKQESIAALQAFADTNLDALLNLLRQARDAR